MGWVVSQISERARERERESILMLQMEQLKKELKDLEQQIGADGLSFTKGVSPESGGSYTFAVLPFSRSTIVFQTESSWMDVEAVLSVKERLTKMNMQEVRSPGYCHDQSPAAPLKSEENTV